MNDPSLLKKERHRSTIALIIILFLFITSGLLLAYLLRDMDWQLIRQTSLSTLTLIFLSTVLGTLIYTYLIHLLVRSSGYRSTLWRAYLVLTASLSANYITPVKVGVPLRIYLYNKLMSIPVAIGTALVTVETIVGMLVPALIASVSTVFLFPEFGLVPAIILMTLLLAGVLVGRQISVLNLLPYLERLPFFRFTRRLVNFAIGVQSGLRYLSPLVVLAVVMLDILMLALQALRLWLVLSIFGPVPSFWALLAVLTISVTAGNVSMIPMGLGVRDASFTLLLAQLGIANEIALSAAVIQRLFSPGWPLLLGVISSQLLGLAELMKPSK